jgi:hypothetical protein
MKRSRPKPTLSVLTRPYLERVLASLHERFTILGATAQRQIGGGGQVIGRRSVGAEGPAGAAGQNVKGPPGNAGPAGADAVGPRGATGATGPPGGDAMKTAILKLSDGRNVGLLPQESQDVLFEDVITFILPPFTRQRVIPVCRVFAACCEDDITITAVTLSEPVPHAAVLSRGEITLTLPQPHAQPLRVTITLHGTRRGYTGMRHARHWKPEDVEANNAFYREFHNA